VSEMGPDEHLLQFMGDLQRPIQREISEAIALAFEKPLPDPALEFTVYTILQPGHGPQIRLRTILVAGLIDHLVEIAFGRFMAERDGVRTIAASHWQVTRIRWLALRAKELSPSTVDDLENYRANRKG
jgi:hypothetical protein